jgi:hypothetical protein
MHNMVFVHWAVDFPTLVLGIILGQTDMTFLAWAVVKLTLAFAALVYSIRLRYGFRCRASARLLIGTPLGSLLTRRPVDVTTLLRSTWTIQSNVHGLQHRVYVVKNFGVHIIGIGTSID